MKAPRAIRPPDAQNAVIIGLNACIVTVAQETPRVLVLKRDGNASDGLPFGPFEPEHHRTLEIGLRNLVQAQAQVSLGYVEQLYTFGDRGRHAEDGDTAPHVVSIGYLALTRVAETRDVQRGAWRSWYQYFPWEDWRKGRPQILDGAVLPRLREWADRPRRPGSPARPIERADRVRICFGVDGATWDEEKVLDRYELMYEAGMVAEALRDRPEVAAAQPAQDPLGSGMRFDHRRILATAIGRVRAKIKYRPVIFELMPDEFTLFELQRTVEAILGPHLHKQNFRRLVESAGLVEPTGEVRTRTGGRPAKLYRFRREVLLERPSPGVRVKSNRA